MPEVNAEDVVELAELYQKTLQKISDIRDSMIGLQQLNWSEHIYPLVAALDEAGFKGAGYKIARENAGTMFDEIRVLRKALRAYVLGGHNQDEIDEWVAKPCNGSPFSLGVKALAISGSHRR